MIRMRLSRLLCLLIGLLAMGNGGCGKPAPPPAAKVATVQVMATIYPLADIAKQVGGQVVQATWVVETGQSLHGFESTPQLRHQLRSVELILAGGQTDSWASEGLADPYQSRRIIRLDVLRPDLILGEDPGYLWLDPLLAREAARELASRIEVLRPKVDASLQERTAAVIASIDQITAEYQPKLSQALVRKVLVLDSDFNQFLRRFSLSPVPTVSRSPMQLSEEDVRLITRISRENNTRILIVPADTPDLIIRDLEVRAGLQIVPLDPLGTSAAGGRNTYQSILRFNLDQLVRATTLQ